MTDQKRSSELDERAQAVVKAWGVFPTAATLEMARQAVRVLAPEPPQCEQLWELGDTIPQGVDHVEDSSGASWHRDPSGGPGWLPVGSLSEGVLLASFGPVRETPPEVGRGGQPAGHEQEVLLPALREARDTLWEIVEKARLPNKFERKAMTTARRCRDAISPYDDDPVPSDA